jgi:hypothetical protein
MYLINVPEFAMPDVPLILEINIREKTKWQSRIDNPDTDNTWHARHKTKTNKATQKTKIMSNTDPHQKPGVNPDTHKG